MFGCIAKSAYTCSKLTIETLVSILTTAAIESIVYSGQDAVTASRCFSQLSCVFIVNFEHISHLVLVYIVNFEEVNADWVNKGTWWTWSTKNSPQIKKNTKNDSQSPENDWHFANWKPL